MQWIFIMQWIPILLLYLPHSTCSYIAYAPESKTNTSSLSGDFVEIKEGSSTNSITVNSSSISSEKATVDVSYFCGGGANPEVRSKRPTIRSTAIYRALFDRESFPKVFNRVLNKDDVEANFTLSSDDLHKIQLTVRDTDNPFIVKNGSIAYFWGVNKLPAEKAEASEFMPTNDKRIVSYCNTTGMDRCAATISDFPHVAPFIFLSAEGQQLTQFAWICPHGTVCCAWECCIEKEINNIVKEILIVFLTMLGIALVISGIGGIIEECKKRNRNPRRFAPLRESTTTLAETRQ